MFGCQGQLHRPHQLDSHHRFLCDVSPGPLASPFRAAYALAPSPAKPRQVTPAGAPEHTWWTCGFQKEELA